MMLLSSISTGTTLLSLTWSEFIINSTISVLKAAKQVEHAYVI